MIVVCRSLDSHLALWRHPSLSHLSSRTGVKTYHPRNLFLVNIAAMGKVVASVDENSVLSPELLGAWYGTTVVACQLLCSLLLPPILCLRRMGSAIEAY